MTTILCAIDVSDEKIDDTVLSKAAQLAALDGAQLDVVTVVPNYGMSVISGFFNEDHMDKARTEAKRRLEDVCKTTLGAEANAKVRHIVATGSIYEEVLSVAKKGGADIIVVGAHKPGFADYLMGPNAARIVRHSPASVMVVRH